MNSRKRLAAAIIKQALADLFSSPLQDAEKEFDRQVNRSTAKAWLMGQESSPVMRAAGLKPQRVRMLLVAAPQVIAEAVRG